MTTERPANDLPGEPEQLSGRAAGWDEFRHLPPLLTAKEVAQILRKSPKAVYTMKARGQLAGVVPIHGGWLVRKKVLLDSLAKGCAPAPTQRGR